MAWKDDEEKDIRNIFMQRVGRRLSDMMREVHIKNWRPFRISEGVWAALQKHWAVVDFAKLSDQAKKNIALEKGGSSHCVA